MWPQSRRMQYSRLFYLDNIHHICGALSITMDCHLYIWQMRKNQIRSADIAFNLCIFICTCIPWQSIPRPWCCQHQGECQCVHINWHVHPRKVVTPWKTESMCSILSVLLLTGFVFNFIKCKIKLQSIYYYPWSSTAGQRLKLLIFNIHRLFFSLIYKYFYLQKHRDIFQSLPKHIHKLALLNVACRDHNITKTLLTWTRICCCGFILTDSRDSQSQLTV